MQLLLLLLIGYGITTIITNGEIFKPLRNRLDTGGTKLKNNFWGLLISCPMCVGFWVGFFLSFSYYSPSSTYLFDYNFKSSFMGVLYVVYSCVLDGALISGFSWTIHSLMGLVDRRDDYYYAKTIYLDFMMKETEKNRQDKQRELLIGSKIEKRD